MRGTILVALALALALLGLADHSPRLTAQAPAEKPAGLEARLAKLEKHLEKLEAVEQRLERMEKHLLAVTAALAKAAPRHQMLSAGDQVVILDTNKGTVQKIGPVTKTQPRYQAFTVGRSVIIVDTSLGTTTTRDGTK
jgi:hypothetical protein